MVNLESFDEPSLARKLALKFSFWREQVRINFGMYFEIKKDILMSFHMQQVRHIQTIEKCRKQWFNHSEWFFRNI
jgi:hypothetical protein